MTTATPNLPAPSAPETPAQRRVYSQNLLAGAREIVIVHKQTEYRLRLTQFDRLILTK